MTQHWIGVVSRSHVMIGVAGGFLQLNHGKRSALARLRAGDRIAMYSPRTSYPDGDLLQAFTAIGTVRTGEVYQARMTPDFEPFRIDVAFEPCLEAPIRPLIDALGFIRDMRHWGAAFRFGYLKVPAEDFARIAAAMQPADVPVTPGAADLRSAPRPGPAADPEPRPPAASRSRRRAARETRMPTTTRASAPPA